MYSSHRSSLLPSQAGSTTSTQTHEHTQASYLTYPVTHVVSGLYRRLTEPSFSSSQIVSSQSSHKDMNDIYTPKRTASPFQPPPLASLSLKGIQSSTSPSAQILSRTLAEEIRLLVPPRLQLVSDWTLAYSLEQNGSSLGTLYNQCEEYRGKRAGFIFVIRDSLGGIFGAFLTDAPHPSPHYYGTGECFLWRATLLPTSSLLSSLPPPPSADTTNLQRSTTIASSNGKSSHMLHHNSHHTNQEMLSSSRNANPSISHRQQQCSGTSTPERIRFKAFPYSGVNEYMIFCEQDYLSVGGGDGKYGLWVDGMLERGVSGSCLTFGNEALSEEGEKFEIVGVEVWYVGV